MSEGHVATHTLLHADVSEVTVPLATGLRHRHVMVEEPEEALLKVLGATDAAAVELHRGAQGGGGSGVGQQHQVITEQTGLTVVMMAFHVEEKTWVLL